MGSLIHAIDFLPVFFPPSFSSKKEREQQVLAALSGTDVHLKACQHCAPV